MLPATMSTRIFALLLATLPCVACASSSAPVVGAPCSPEMKTLGAEHCKDASQFCHVLMCRSGRWEELEVPPGPAPPSSATPNPPS